MDAKAWLETLGETVKVLGSALLGGAFMRLRYRRSASSTRVGEAEDSGAHWFMRKQREHTESVQRERDAVLQEIKDLRERLTAAEIRGAARGAQMQAVRSHVLLATRLLSEKHPEMSRALGSSEFMALLDEHDSRR